VELSNYVFHKSDRDPTGELHPLPKSGIHNATSFEPLDLLVACQTSIFATYPLHGISTTLPTDGSAAEALYQEALAIAQKRGQASIPPDQQPQAYGLMRDTIQQMGGRIDRVLVNDATQSQYLAQIVVSDGSGGEVKVIKARPGDAVALALQSGAPIFVENQVLDRFGTKGSG